MNQTTTSTPQDIEDFLGADAKPFWKRKVVWIPALLLLVGLIAWYVWGREEDPVEYITEDVATRSLDLVVTATGNLRPTNQVDVGSETSGKIDAILVDVNDRVVRGQVLARINTDLIDDQITQGRASLGAARGGGTGACHAGCGCGATGPLAGSASPVGWPGAVGTGTGSRRRGRAA